MILHWWRVPQNVLARRECGVLFVVLSLDVDAIRLDELAAIGGNPFWAHPVRQPLLVPTNHGHQYAFVRALWVRILHVDVDAIRQHLFCVVGRVVAVRQHVPGMTA